MLAADLSGAICQCRYNNPVGRQIVETYGKGHDIDNRVNGAHLMEVDFINVFSMHRCFGLCNNTENPKGQLTRIVCQIAGADDFNDVV